MGHELGAPKMGDICGALVPLRSSFLSGGDRAFGTPSLTKLEARVVIKENWRQTQNIGRVGHQLPPTPIPGSLNPRGGSLSLNFPCPSTPKPSHFTQLSLPLHIQSLHCSAVKATVSCCDNIRQLKPLEELLIWGSDRDFRRHFLSVCHTESSA